MAKFISILLRSQIRMAKLFFKRMDLHAYRLGQDKIGLLGAKVLKGKVNFQPHPSARFHADWAVPVNAVPGSVILYLHGGGYTAGSLDYARGFGGMLAFQAGCKTLCVGYRLAPEHPFPAALEDALEAYRSMLEEYPADRIALAGESAGGGLCFALALRLKELGLPQPACIAAISPWTDLTLSGDSCRQNVRRDPTLLETKLRESARQYAGEDTKNPLASPLFGDLSGLPPALLYAGSHEILRDDSAELAKHLQSSGVPCELHIVEGMWHVFVLYGVPEAKEALWRIGAFIQENTRS